jgi:hypothetical protein
MKARGNQASPFSIGVTPHDLGSVCHTGTPSHLSALLGLAQFEGDTSPVSHRLCPRSEPGMRVAVLCGRPRQALPVVPRVTERHRATGGTTPAPWHRRHSVRCDRVASVRQLYAQVRHAEVDHHSGLPSMVLHWTVRSKVVRQHCVACPQLDLLRPRVPEPIVSEHCTRQPLRGRRECPAVTECQRPVIAPRAQWPATISLVREEPARAWWSQPSSAAQRKPLCGLRHNCAIIGSFPRKIA